MTVGGTTVPDDAVTFSLLPITFVGVVMDESYVQDVRRVTYPVAYPTSFPAVEPLGFERVALQLEFEIEPL